MNLIPQAIAVAGKDIRVELRAHHAVGVVLPFAGTLLIAFGLSLGPGRTLLEETAPGLLWLAIVFASVLSFRGSYESEGEDGALEEVRVATIDPGAVFIGKTAAVVLQLVALEAAIVLLTEALFGITLGPDVAILAGSLLFGTVGLAAVGNLFGVLTESARARQAVFPLLVFPVVIPDLVAGVKAVALPPSAASSAGPWLGLLLAYAVVYLCVGALLFATALED